MIDLSIRRPVSNASNWAKAKVGSLVALGAAGATSAQAAVPETVTTALTDMKADALTVAGLVLVAIIAVVAFKFMRKGF